MGIGNRKALFPAVRGTVALTPDAMDRINLDVMIDATQLRADDSLTTNRLKGDAFFNVAKYPTVRFQGTDLSMATQTSGIVRGNLTARGVTRPVTLNVSFSAPPSTTSLKEPIRLTGVTTINRKDFGMTAYSLIVGKKVTISIRTKLVPA
jgi:polyisoprenoid-binding protein YceI